MGILNIPPEPTVIDLIAMFLILAFGLALVSFVLLFLWAIVDAIRYEAEAKKQEKELERERRMRYDRRTIRS